MDHADFQYRTAHEVPIVLQAADGAYELLGARWGLIPSWWRRPALPTLSFNARSEEAAHKPMWRHSLRAQRCLMPAARGWYEWNEKEQTRNERGRKVHQPYYIHAKADEVVAFAGLWSCWIGPDTVLVMTCALMSRDAAP